MATTAERQEVRAVARWVRMSPRKARLVTEHIRGRSVPEARTVLAFTPRAAAREIEKVLKSAVSNAEANHGLIGDELLVSAAYIDVGPTMKRWRARARGRVARIKKRTCHITLKLAENPAAAEKPRRPQRAAKAETAAPKAEAAAPETAEAKPKASRLRKSAKRTEGPTEEKPKRTRAPRKKKTEETES